MVGPLRLQPPLQFRILKVEIGSAFTLVTAQTHRPKWLVTHCED